MPAQFTNTLIDQIIKGRCAEYADLMGLHKTTDGQLRFAAFVPGAKSVDLVSSNGKRVLATMQSLHAEGLFTGILEGRKSLSYRLRVTHAAGTAVIDDPYRFGRCLDAAELHLFSQGRHDGAWQMLGAQLRSIDGVEGVHFVLWAPQARRVSLLLPSYQWDGRVLLMYPHARHGLWELFVPGLAAGTPYCYELMNAQLETMVLRYDPFARQVEPQTHPLSGVAAALTTTWNDGFWQQTRSDQSGQEQPVCIQELSLAPLQVAGVHWPQLAALLVPEIKRLGFSHLLLRDVQPFWFKGKQRQTAMLATLPALGRHDELQPFIEMAHEHELALLWDLPLSALLEAHGLGTGSGFDWAHQGGALASVVAACIGFWHCEMHVDGFRLREVDELLRPDHRAGGRRRAMAGVDVNPFAREWLGLLLQQLRERYPSLLLVVDTALPLPELTLSARKGGMGADFRSSELHWPWLNPVPASHCGHQLAQLLRHWQDGNPHQQLALLAARAGTDPALLQLMLLMFWTLPGRKQLRSEWRLLPDPGWQPERGHDFRLGFDPVLEITGTALLQQLNGLYQHLPGLYELDASHEGINVLHCSETVCAFERCSRLGHEALLVVINAGDAVATGVQLRLQCDRRYRLVCSVGQGTFPAVLQTSDARSASGCTAAIDVAGLGGALYALEN